MQLVVILALSSLNFPLSSSPRRGLDQDPPGESHFLAQPHLLHHTLPLEEQHRKLSIIKKYLYSDKPIYH